MNYWIRSASFLICLHVVGSSDSFVVVGQGRCQKQWTVPERKTELYTVREQCRYYERCYMKTVTKSRTTIIDKPMKVDFCCEGYVNMGSIYELNCKPTCEPMCVFGECSAPGNCTCNEGYQKSSSSNHICEHTCVPECVNATCVNVNKCECYAGFFKKDQSNPHVCSPHCTFGCVHGDCTGPEICTCHPGYALSSNHSVCLPVCDLECTHGICSGPNTCSCDDGYIETPIWNICDPYCSEFCINGQCTSPEQCTCWEGYYETSNSTCAPHCSNVCNNGECIAPETCSCNEGYEKDENDTCIPTCPMGCENGTCISPDNCVCNDRHYYSDGTCLPWCVEGCTNGDCTGPTECYCPEGTLRLSPSYCAPSCSNVDTCIDHYSSFDVSRNITTLELILGSSLYPNEENQPILCTQSFSESCCSIGRNLTEVHSIVIICSTKGEFDCDDHISLVAFRWTAHHYENRNDTNMNVTIIADTQWSTYNGSDIRKCYIQLCPSSERALGTGCDKACCVFTVTSTVTMPLHTTLEVVQSQNREHSDIQTETPCSKTFQFVTGETRISCAKDSGDDNLKQEDSNEDYLPVTAAICTLIFLVAVTVLTATFYYMKRIRKISYEVNTRAEGECTAQLCHDQEVMLEDKF